MWPSYYQTCKNTPNILKLCWVVSLPTLTPQPTCCYFHLIFWQQVEAFIFFSFPVSFKYSISLLRIPLWYSCSSHLYIFGFSLSFMLALFCFVLILFFFLTFLKLSHFCCYPMSSVFTIKRLFAGARSSAGFLLSPVNECSTLLVAPLIHQVVADTAGYFEETKERISRTKICSEESCEERITGLSLEKAWELAGSYREIGIYWFGARARQKENPFPQDENLNHDRFLSFLDQCKLTLECHPLKLNEKQVDFLFCESVLHQIPKVYCNFNSLCWGMMQSYSYAAQSFQQYHGP